MNDVNKEKNLITINGKNIKRLRERRGLKQLQLGYAIGYDSNSMISQIESGQRGMTLDKLKAMADELNVHPAALFTEREYTDSELDLIENIYTFLSKRKTDIQVETVNNIIKMAMK